MRRSWRRPYVGKEVTGCCPAFKVLEEGPLAAASARAHSLFVRL